MNNLPAMQALLFAGECLLGSGLVLAAAFAAARGETAAKRHLIWLAAFAALLALPALAAIVPPRIVLLHEEPQAVQTFAPIEAATADAPAVPAPRDADKGIVLPDIAAGVLLLWLAGVVLVAGQSAAAAIGLRRLYRRSVRYDFPASAVPRIAKRCDLRLSKTQDGPMTWGLFRPVVLMPWESLYWPRERLDAVLRHEFAHVERRDSLIQILSLLVCALYWPNPLVWLAAMRLRREAEIAADDAVLRTGMKPSAYAGELLALAARLGAARKLFAELPLAMAAPSSLELRVRSVLSSTASRAGTNAMDILKIAGFGLAATALLALARPSFAEAQKAPPAPPPVATQPGAPAEPAAPADVPAPPAPAAAPAAPAAVASPAHRHRHLIIRERDDGSDRVIMQMDDSQMTDAEAEAQAALAKVRDKQAAIQSAMAALKKVQPEIDKAMAAAKPEIARAMAAARAQQRVALTMQRAEIAEAVAEAAEAKVERKVLEKARPAIEKAIEDARRQVEEEERAGPQAPTQPAPQAPSEPAPGP